MLGLEPVSEGRDHLLDELDRRIADLSANRVTLPHSIAKQTPGYAVALQWAVGTIRFNKRRDGCFSFGMPGQLAIAVWVDSASGTVTRSEPIIW